ADVRALAAVRSPHADAKPPAPALRGGAARKRPDGPALLGRALRHAPGRRLDGQRLRPAARRALAAAPSRAQARAARPARNEDARRPPRLRVDAKRARPSGHGERRTRSASWPGSLRSKVTNA